MTRLRFALPIVLAMSLGACSTAALQQPVPTAAVQDVNTALASYQAALGVAQIALQKDPTLLAQVNALTAKAAPYVAAVQTGATLAGTAPSLGALAAELLFIGAPDIVASPKA